MGYLGERGVGGVDEGVCAEDVEGCASLCYYGRFPPCGWLVDGWWMVLMKIDFEL